MNRRELFTGLFCGLATYILPKTPQTKKFLICSPLDIAYSGHLTYINVSADLERKQIYELGRKRPYHRTVNFPIELKKYFNEKKNLS